MASAFGRGGAVPEFLSKRNFELVVNRDRIAYATAGLAIGEQRVVRLGFALRPAFVLAQA